MSAWIESHSALRDHPKLKRLARSLGINGREATGLLHWLWWWAMEYAPDGDLAGFSDEDVADGIDWEGDAGALMAALANAGFLDGRVLHDWEDYGGKLQYRRRANAERMRASRSRHEDEPCEPRAPHVQDACGARGQDRTGQTGQEAPRARRTAPEGDWVAAYTDAMTDAGREPTKSEKAIFGRKVKELGAVDPPTMRDAIARMIELEKSPGLLAYVYGDCKQIAEREVFQVATGGRPRVR